MGQSQLAAINVCASNTGCASPPVENNRVESAKVSRKVEKILSRQGFVSDYLFLFASLSNEETLSRCDRNAARADRRCRSRHLQVFPRSSALAFSCHLPVLDEMMKGAKILRSGAAQHGSAVALASKFQESH